MYFSVNDGEMLDLVLLVIVSIKNIITLNAITCHSV